MPKRYSLTQEQINEVPQSNWYRYTLECGDSYYSRVRIVVPKDYSHQEHSIQCANAHEVLKWQFITGMEAVSDEHVSNVSSGTAFILPNRILRAGNFNPFPYSIGKNRDY